VPRRRSSRRPRRLRANFTPRQALREVDGLLSKAEEDLERGQLISALSAYMLARDLTCASAGDAQEPALVREWQSVGREMAMVLDEIGEALRQAGVR
jgi:hypothetical protein